MPTNISKSQKPSQTKSTLEWACHFAAERKWQIYPLQPDIKKPLPGSQGKNDATDDLDRIKAWYSKHPKANLAVNLQKSGLVCIDVDSHHDDCEWDKFIEGKELPPTLTQKSARGGTHFIFRAGEGASYPKALCKRVDILHNGGLVLSPSTFEGKPYSWLSDPDANIADAPTWIPEKKEPEAPKTKTAKPKTTTKQIRQWLDCIDADCPYHKWLHVLMGLHHHFQGSTAGLAVAQEWSATGSKYKPGEVSEKWKSFHTAGEGITIASVADLAIKEGYRSDEGRIPKSDHAGLLKRFAEQHPDTILYTAKSGKWYVWNSYNWKPTGETHLRNLISETAVEETGQASANTVRGIKYLAEGHYDIDNSEIRLDNDPYLLGAGESVADLKTGKLIEPHPDQYITRSLCCTPDYTAPHDLWDAFLHYALDEDQETIDAIERFLGYCLTGNISEHALLFVYGVGGTGKSVFTEIVETIFGSYAHRAPLNLFERSYGDRHPTELAGLSGIRLVLVGETGEGKRLDEQKVKSVTAGEPITARFMQKDYFTYKPAFKVIMVGNHAPRLSSVGEDMKRRINIVPFNRKPEIVDENLKDKILVQSPGIAAKLIRKAAEWSDQGLCWSKTIEAETADYFSLQDEIGQWMSVAGSPDPYHWVSTLALKDSFNKFREANSESHWTTKRFTSQLKNTAGMTRKRQKATGPHGWTGFKLKENQLFGKPNPFSDSQL